MLLALLLNLKQPSGNVPSVTRGGSDFIFLMASFPPRGTLESDTNVLPKMNQQTNWTIWPSNLHNMELTISWVVEHQETHPGSEWKSSNPAIYNQHSMPFGVLHLHFQLRLDSFGNTPLGMWEGQVFNEEWIHPECWHTWPLDGCARAPLCVCSLTLLGFRT